jgi:phage host-nuclease inhibitor protein Gam
MEYQQAREVARLYAELSDAQAKIELLQARIACLEAEVDGLLALSQEYLRRLRWARASVWV